MHKVKVLTIGSDNFNTSLEELKDFLSFDLYNKLDDLTEDKLNNEIMVNIKKTIKKMYIGCEVDFQRGIQIYNQIYKQRNHM